MLPTSIKVFLAFAILPLTIISCSDNEPSQVSGITYTNQIQDMISGCANAGCHSMDASADVQSLASYQDVIAFNNSDRIIASLRHESGFEPMPRGSNKWTDEEVSILMEWFDNGAPE